MAKTIELHDVPDEVYARLTERAALAGISVSELLLREIGAAAMRRPPLVEVLERIATREPVVVDKTPAEIIRELRDSDHR